MTREERDAKILELVPKYGMRGTARAMGVTIGCITHIVRKSGLKFTHKNVNQKLAVPILEQAPAFNGHKPKPAKAPKPELKFGPSQCAGVAAMVICQAVRDSGRGKGRADRQYKDGRHA